MVLNLNNYFFIDAFVLCSAISITAVIINMIIQRNKKTNFIDPLTKLENKGGFDAALEQAIKEKESFYLFYCDLDNFKQLNDTIGHKAGDELLIQVANIWRDTGVCDHTVFRQGGDEFSVIAKCSRAKAERLAEAMINELEKKKKKEFVYISASIGIANFPEDADNDEDLKKYADTTMYEAKRSGKNQYKFFNRDIYQKIMNEYSLEKIAIDIADNNEFEMVYQPQWNTRTHELIGFESLVRAKGADTQDFIIAAENNGTIFDIDLNIFRRVLKETKEIVKANPSIVISVNVSGKHISLPSFYSKVYEIMSEEDYPPSNIKFEITETSAVKNITTSADKIKKLKRIGVKIALDDFGIAYSNLRYLIEINVDSIKIDKSFVDTIDRDSRLVGFIIELGHMLDCEVIAEGVETEAQLEMLRTYGCDTIQGFLWGRPVSISEAKELIKNVL